jgi:hypothetical protein
MLLQIKQVVSSNNAENPGVFRRGVVLVQLHVGLSIPDYFVFAVLHTCEQQQEHGTLQCTTLQQ